MADESEPDDLPRRRTPELPPEFAPLTPLAGTSFPERAPRAPGEAPRLRLTASASRRRAPDRPTAAAPPAATEPPPATAAPVEPPAEPRSRRTALVIGAVCALALAVAVVGALLLRPGGAPSTEQPTTAPTQEAAPATTEFDPPVTLAPDSEYVETDVLEDGDLQVTHWISTTAPMDRFRVRPPTSPGLTGLAVDAEDVVLAADGVRLDASAVRIDSPHDLPGARELYVSYRLAGAVQLNGSVAGRALAPITSLGVGLESRSLARTQAFPGGRVLTLACLAQGARAVPESCGTYEEGVWEVSSPAGEAPVTVIAQLDLTQVR